MKKTTFSDYMNLHEAPGTPAPAPAPAPAEPQAAPKFISGSTQILSKYQGLKGLVHQIVDFNNQWIQFERQVNLALVDAEKSSHGMSRQHTGMKKNIQELQAELQEWKTNYETTKQEFEQRLKQSNEVIDNYQTQLQQAQTQDEAERNNLQVIVTEMQHHAQEKHQDFVREQKRAEQLEAKLQRLFAQGQTDTTEADQIMEQLNTQLAASKKREVELTAIIKALQSTYENLSASHAKTPRFEPANPNATDTAHTDHKGSVIRERRSFSEYVKRQ